MSTDEQEGWLPASILQPLNDLDKSSCESHNEIKTTGKSISIFIPHELVNFL